MRPNEHVIFQDDFSGDQLQTERYTTTIVGGGDASHAIDGISAEGGALKLVSDEDDTDSIQLWTKDPLQFSLSQEAVMECRFRLVSDDSTRLYIGFYQDATNYIVLSISSYNIDGGIRLMSVKGGSSTFDSPLLQMDPSWHTMQLRLLGLGNGVECVLDYDEANKMEIANGDLPIGEQYSAYIQTLTRRTKALIAGTQRGVYVSNWRITQKPRYEIPTP